MFLALAGPTPILTRLTPLPVLAHDVIGRHLEAVPDDAGRLAPPPPPATRSASIVDIARQHQLGDARVAAQLLQAPAHELVDIAVIVGQQHPRLHRPPVGARVMHEAPQRVIDARGVEQRERPLGVRADLELAVGDLVADHRTATGWGNSARDRPRRRRRARVRRRSRTRRGRRSPARRRRLRSRRRIPRTSGVSCSSR